MFDPNIIVCVDSYCQITLNGENVTLLRALLRVIFNWFQAMDSQILLKILLFFRNEKNRPQEES
jgi:hypothetical protein